MLLLTGLIAIVSLVITSPLLAFDPPAGEVIFKANKCQMCHKYTAPEPDAEIDTTGPPNLRFAGDRHEAEWTVKFLKKEIDNQGRKHKVIFKGSTEDLNVLALWLTNLKSPVADTTSKGTVDHPPKVTE